MWLFTSIGYFNVSKKNGEQPLTVRARCSADVDCLRQQFMPELASTSTKGGHDYPFRATLRQTDSFPNPLRYGFLTQGSHPANALTAAIPFYSRR